jgi:hypothetical protein
LPDSIDNIYIYLTPVGSIADFTSENKWSISDSSFVRKGYFVFNGIADTQKNIYSIWSEKYPAIGGLVIIESGSITYNYQQEDGKGYVYARGTYLNDLLTDSILIPSIRMAEYGEMLMSGKINMENPEMAELIDEMRNNAIMFKKNILSFIHNNIHNPVGEYIFLTYSQYRERAKRDISLFVGKCSQRV